MQLRRIGRALGAILIIAVLILLALLIYSSRTFNADHEAGVAFCDAVKLALSCQGGNDECLLAYHRNVTPRLADAKAGRGDAWRNPFRLNWLDEIYADGKASVVSEHRLSAPEAFLQERQKLYQDCLATLPSD